MLANKNKPLSVLFFSLMTIAIAAVTAYLTVGKTVVWNNLFTSIGLMIAAIPLHIFAKKLKIGYVISWLLNSVGIGSAISAYYTYSEITLDIESIMISAIPAVIILLFVCLSLQSRPDFKKILLITVSVITALLLVAAVVFWIKEGTRFYSLAFFFLVTVLIWLGVLYITAGHSNRPILRDISFGGFGAVIVVVVIAAALITEDEGPLELAFDIGDGAGSAKKSKRK